MDKEEKEQGWEQGEDQDPNQGLYQEEDQENHQETTKDEATAYQEEDQESGQEEAEEEEWEEPDWGDNDEGDYYKEFVEEHAREEEQEEEEPEAQESGEYRTDESDNPTSELIGEYTDLLESAADAGFGYADTLKARAAAKISGQSEKFYHTPAKLKDLIIKLFKIVLREAKIKPPSPMVGLIIALVIWGAMPFALAMVHRRLFGPPVPERSPEAEEPKEEQMEETVEIVPEVKEPAREVSIYATLDEYKENRKDFRLYDDGSYKRANGATTNSPKGTGGKPAPVILGWINEAQEAGLKGAEMNHYVYQKLHGYE